MLQSSVQLSPEMVAIYRSFRKLLTVVEQNLEKVQYKDDDLLQLGVRVSPLSLESDTIDEANYFQPLSMEHAVVQAQTLGNRWRDYKTSVIGSNERHHNYEFGQSVCHFIRNHITGYDDETMRQPIWSTKWNMKG